MKGKQLLIVLVLLAVLGGAALFLNRKQSASWSSSASTSGGKVLDFPLNDVTHLTIKGGGPEVNLVKKDDLWTVKERADYPADFEKVSALLRKLWELRPVQDVKIGPSQVGRLQLTEPTPEANSSTLIDLKAGDDKRVAALLLGKKHMRNSDEAPGDMGGVASGRYVMRQDGSNAVFLISETLDEAQTKPEQWLNHDFIKIEAPKLISLASPTGGANWTVARDSATTPWKLSDAKPGEEFDPAKVAGIMNLFAGGAFTDVLAPDAPVAETGLDKPTTARFETFDNFVYELRIGKLMGENYPVLVSVKGEMPTERASTPEEKPEDKARLDQEFETKKKELAEKLEKGQKMGSRPYLIAKSTIEQLVKDRSALMAEKKASPTPSPTPSKQSSPRLSTPRPATPSPTPKSSPK